MNAKFVMFCLATLGSVMMLYMWFSIKNSFQDTQAIEEQYGFRISSLKSEVDFEKKLMASLRKESKNNGIMYNEKSSLLDSMKKKESQWKSDKIKMQKKYDDLKDDFDKMSKSNQIQVNKMKSENEAQMKEDNAQIQSLESEIEKLESELKEVQKKMKKSGTHLVSTSEDKSGKANGDAMQAKAPKINFKQKESNTLEKQKMSDEKIKSDLNNPDVIETKIKSNSMKEEVKGNDGDVVHKSKPKLESKDKTLDSIEGKVVITTKHSPKKQQDKHQLEESNQNVNDLDKEDNVLKPSIVPQSIKSGNVRPNFLYNNHLPNSNNLIDSNESNQVRKMSQNEQGHRLPINQANHQLVPPLKDRVQMENKKQMDSFQKKRDPNELDV